MLFRFLFLLIFLPMSLSTLPAAAQSTPGLEATLKAARWRQRVLLVCAPAATDAQLLQQRELLAAARLALAARDLRVRELLLPGLSAADRQHLRRLGGTAEGFQVLLIGKDGGLKRRYTQPVKPEILFGTIDQMPMRRQEMKGGR